jgi:hypothetical protein
MQAAAPIIAIQVAALVRFICSRNIFGAPRVRDLLHVMSLEEPLAGRLGLTDVLGGYATDA